ncbi:MAG: hypothetical protein SOZ00_02595 [Tidjanibacter sp.]|nr:hypothetical protein [Tidjanibacter sp.]
MSEILDDYNYDDQEQPTPDHTVKGYRIIIVVLIVIIGFLTFAYFRTTSDLKREFKADRDTLNNQITGLITEIDNINVRNDSTSRVLMDNISVERDKADSLMSRLKKERYINRDKIKQYEKELGTLRTIMRRYVTQIDSLNSLNQKLAKQNVTFRKEVATQTSRANIAEERAAELSDKIRLGAIVKARDIKIAAFNSNGTATTRASRTSRFKVDLTLTANELTLPGERRIYVRITAPDGAVMTDGADHLFEFEGDQISYSASRDVDYQNGDLDVSIFFAAADVLSGAYTAEVYMDGYLTGSAEMSLR